MRNRRATLSVQLLDGRVLPAAFLHYTDVDGDLVTVRTSAGTDANLSFGAQFDAGHHQLQTLFLFANDFQGTSVSITSTPGPTGGDGLVNVGYINALGTNLGNVVIHGDLGAIDAGTGGTSAVAVRSLKVISMGRFGTMTQGASPSLFSTLKGALGSLTVHGDLNAVTLQVSGPNGKVGPVHVGGSLIGGGTYGAIRSAGALGPVFIGGDLVGNGFKLNGTAVPTGVIACGGKLVSLTIGGSLIGSAIDNSGQINIAGDAGPIRVVGNLIAGTGDHSASIYGGGPGKVASVSIGGSLVSGSLPTIAGAVDLFNDAVGPVTIGGDVRSVIGVGQAASVVVRGSVGDHVNWGYIEGSMLGNVQVGGSVQGMISAARISSVTVGGSVRGNISANDSIGRLVIGGSLVNSYVGVMGPQVPDGKPCVGIGSITVFGSVEKTQILAGFSPVSPSGNADVQIGPVTVHGDWIATDLTAGISAGIQSDVFGDGDDGIISSGAPNQPHSHSRIGPIVIQGELLGTPGFATTRGIEAEEVVSLTIGGTAIPLKPGRGNDTTAIHLGANGDVVVREF